MSETMGLLLFQSSVSPSASFYNISCGQTLWEELNALYTAKSSALAENIYQPRWGAALICVQCCAEHCRNIVCVCNGKKCELNVGVCSRGGDQPAIAAMLVPKDAEQELFCRSEWEEEEGTAGWEQSDHCCNTV